MRFNINNQIVKINNDFMNWVLFPNGDKAPMVEVFPEIQSLNFDAGYAVVNNRIVASLGASDVVMQNDGEPVGSISQSFHH